MNQINIQVVQLIVLLIMDLMQKDLKLLIFNEKKSNLIMLSIMNQQRIMIMIRIYGVIQLTIIKIKYQPNKTQTTNISLIKVEIS